MNLSFNSLRSIFVILACFIAASVQVNAQGTNVQTETFPNVFNNNATGNINSTFVGNMGTWSAYSNRSYASVAVISYWNNATPNSLFIKNFKGSSASSSIATSPSINLSAYTCAPNATLIFNVDPSKLSGNNTGTVYTIDFSNNGGSTWTTMISQTAAQIKAAMPIYGWNLGTLDIPASYLVSNFKYRITGSSPANSSYDNEIYFDDLSIYVPNCSTTSCAGNLLNNPGFEAATALDAWDNWGNATITNDDYTGVKAVQVSGGQGGFAQTLSATALKTYKLSVYAKVSGGTEWGGVSIKFSNSSNTILAQQSLTITGSSYQEFTTTLLAPSGTTQVAITFWKNSGSAVFKLDDFCLTESTASISSCNTSNSFNPFSDSKGYNVFAKGTLEFYAGEVEGSVAGGGNLTLTGASRVAINNSGSYPNDFGNSNNYGLVVGGRINYTSGAVSYVNNGLLRLGSTTGTTLWAKDPNNANVNLRATSNAQSSWNGYNSQPVLQVQQLQTVSDATSTSGLNFTTAFTSVVANANLIASYNASSPCNASLNIISISGTSPNITLVDNKINVINITGSYFSTISQITFNNKPTSTRPVIFNMSGTAGYTFNNFQAVGISNNDAPYILYNFSAVTGTIQIGGGNTLYGSVLIPNGKFIWTNSNNVEGQILANLFTLSAGEIHYNPYNVCLPICTVTYSLGDFVWNDLNNNGIQDSGEPGISGVTVNLYADANADNIPDGAAIATTTTNGSGAYSFSNLTSGKYVLAAVIPTGYSVGTTTATSASPGNSTTNDNNGIAIYNTTLVRTNNIDLRSDNPNVDFAFYIPCTGRVTSLYFNKLDGGTDLPIIEGSSFTPAQLNSLYNMEIGFTGSIGSVLFTISGPTASSNIENAAPYNSPGTGGSGWNGSEGNYSVNIKIYSNSGATGTICHDTTINFTYSSTVCTKSTETFPNQYNTGFSKPITNGTFTGSTGTFTVNTSANATVVVTTPYYSPSTSHAIKIVNWATNGSMSETPTPGVGTTSTVSPQINLTNICCPAELTLQYTLWTYTVNAADNTTTFAWDFSNDNGATWNQMVSTTPAALFAAYGANGKVTLSIPVPVMYQNTNFRYRIRSSKPINNAYNFYVFIDDIKISSPTSCAATYTLGDYVWFDVNNNGIQNAGEPGIANVAVKLYYDLNNDNIPDGAAIATTTTNASGAYSFTGLGSNRYIVSIVEPTGYDPATTTGTSSDPNNSTANDNNGVAIYNTTEVRSNSINLTATNNNVDFGLKGTLNLGNLVWNDTNGDGDFDGGEPVVSGVTVRLYVDANGDNIADGAAITTTTTNAQGLYSFTNLPPNKYIVGIVIPTGYISSVNVASSSNPNNDINDDNNGVNFLGANVAGTEVRSNFITLSVGGEPTTDGDGSNGNLTLDFGICGLGGLGDFVWNDLNANGIKDANEVGLAGVNVTLTYPDGTQVTYPTDANGFYFFANLGPGNYTLTFATPTGMIASPSNQGTNDAVDSDPVGGIVNITLAASEINDSVDAGFYGQLSVGNSVWFDANNNGLKDTNEPGISGVTVKLYADANGDNIPDGAAIATTTTNTNGTYSFTNLIAGNYIVGVTLPAGHIAGATTVNSSNPNSDTDNDNNGVTTVSGELRSNFITLSLGGEPASGVDGDGTNGNLTLDFGLKGTLNLGNLVWNDTNGNGEKNTFESGVNGVTVYLYQDANGDNVPDGAAIATTTTAGGGLYGFSNLVPGNYIVGIAKPTGYAKSFTPTSGNNPNTDTDNDNNGVFNYSGIIRSNFITLSVGGEPASGVDGDGTNGNLTLDFAIAKDTDGDDIPDVIDIDDDNDGITDMNESGGYDPLADCDNDGIPNYLDTTPGCSTPTGNDPWGVPYKPLVFTDCNTDGINDFFDWDRDGIINELDLDSDNDGILDVYEARPNGVQFTSVVNGMITGTDADENGLLSSAENGNTNPVLNGLAAQDMDRDGTPNFLDLDSDGDGITDLTEALGVYST
ncbi:MAG: choice-of-anchor A family protein, partial [Bacteroidia bacterium]|nr:choice-of-anchor A family protein [Bacteroidia bacterium]